jgi:hypothetical protein
MSKVATQVNLKKAAKKDQTEKDQKRASELILAYGKLVEDNNALKNELEEKVKPIKAIYDDRLKSLKASIEAAEEELIEIGKRQRKTLFAVDGNWHFPNGYYLHVGSQTIPLFGEKKNEEPGDDFNLSKFVRKFGDYVDMKFKIKELKKIFLNGDSKERKQMVAMEFDLGLKEVIEVKESKKGKDKDE